MKQVFVKKPKLHVLCLGIITSFTCSDGDCRGEIQSLCRCWVPFALPCRNYNAVFNCLLLARLAPNNGKKFCIYLKKRFYILLLEKFTNFFYNQERKKNFKLS